MDGDAPMGLAALEARLRTDLAWLGYPPKSWVPPRTHEGRRVTDVAIVGAGMCGLCAATALKRAGVDNIVLLDRAPAGREGPWMTYARMETLRSPKDLAGPALGLPALTFRAWYEARFGREAWERLGKIPRTMWMDYLVWYRTVLDLPVRNEVAVERVAPHEPGLVALDVWHPGGRERLFARRLVLATGRDGLGGPNVPRFVEGISCERWAHTAHRIDFPALAGCRVGVVGVGASAIDNAAEALEAGAARVDVFVRRPDIPRVNKFTGIGSQGVVHGFAALPDEWKFRFLDHAIRAQTPPPRDSMLRVSRHPNAFFHLASPVRDLAEDGDRIMLFTPGGRHELDFLVLGTGFRVDLSHRPELVPIADHIAFWRERLPAELADANEELASSPDLGPDFAFRERRPGACPGLDRIHCFNYPATMSHGKLSGDIPAVSEGAERLARGIVRSLFVEDREIHFENLVAYDVPELRGDEWTEADATLEVADERG